MKMTNDSFKPVNVEFILAHGKRISSHEALRDISPIEWSKDVLSERFKGNVIIKTKDEEDK